MDGLESAPGDGGTLVGTPGSVRDGRLGVALPITAGIAATAAVALPGMLVGGLWNQRASRLQTARHHEGRGVSREFR